MFETETFLLFFVFGTETSIVFFAGNSGLRVAGCLELRPKCPLETETTPSSRNRREARGETAEDSSVKCEIVKSCVNGGKLSRNFNFQARKVRLFESLNLLLCGN